jgi:hypothetical protein
VQIKAKDVAPVIADGGEVVEPDSGTDLFDSKGGNSKRKRKK